MSETKVQEIEAGKFDCGRRLVIVSNRLPFNAKIEGGELSFQPSAGGLVSGLASYLQGTRQTAHFSGEYLWVGWPGTSIDESLKDSLIQRVREQFSFLSGVSHRRADGALLSRVLQLDALAAVSLFHLVHALRRGIIGSNTNKSTRASVTLWTKFSVRTMSCGCTIIT